MSENSSDNSSDGFDQKFYNPLCLSGYLTPLQRKKLREKRNFFSDDVLREGVKKVNVKRIRTLKRNKDHFMKVPNKRKRSVDRIPQVKCTASKIIKTAKDDKKEKKFFKTSSLHRLEKANFTMPLVLNRNVFLDIDKSVKKTLSFRKKLPLQSNENCHLNSAASTSPAVFPPLRIANNKENSFGNCGPIQSCASEVSSISDATGYNDTRNEVSPDTVEKRSIFDFDWPSDEFLLKRREKARDDIRKMISSKESIEQNTSKERQINDAEPVKLYPVFHIGIKKQAESIQRVKSNPKSGAKKKLDLCKKGEQMIIDAGQKEIGAKICRTCNMIFTIGQEEDEKLHSSYHHMYLINLKFPGWKKENVIGEYADGRVIKVLKDDKNVKLKKIEDILTIANRDLGFPSSAIPTKPDLTFILFISNTKQVAGCIVAEPISSACQVLLADSESALKEHISDQKETLWRIGNWYSSSERVPALCGINRIWVAHSFRRHKVASRMVDCLRCNFIYGHIVSIQELAFTDPSPDGRAFAAAYTGTDNFLVYN